LLNTNFDLPLGVRLWHSEQRRRGHRLKEGYTFSALENSPNCYRFLAMPEAGKVEALLQALADSLPEEIFFILEFYQEQPDPKSEEQPEPTVFYSPYMPTTEILAALKPYLPRLIHDGFVGFGLANNRAGIELFYSEEKVLSFFTDNHIRTMDLLGAQGFPYRPDLLFTTDFGHDHYSLQCHPREALPAPFATMDENDLDYLSFCNELTEALDMYPVEEDLAFFLSRTEQDDIEARLLSHPIFGDFAEEDFGCLLLDWNDFVNECEAAFEGDLYDYRQGLQLRDMIQFVVEGIPPVLGHKILDIIAPADSIFRKNLIDVRKRLDPPGDLAVREDLFWYRGMVAKQGADLRRDLIRQGWYKP
jgi:hypothetical protein